jgi:hypothetical protein
MSAIVAMSSRLFFALIRRRLAQSWKIPRSLEKAWPTPVKGNRQ